MVCLTSMQKDCTRTLKILRFMSNTVQIQKNSSDGSVDRGNPKITQHALKSVRVFKSLALDTTRKKKKEKKRRQGQPKNTSAPGNELVAPRSCLFLLSHATTGKQTTIPSLAVYGTSERQATHKQPAHLQRVPSTDDARAVSSLEFRAQDSAGHGGVDRRSDEDPITSNERQTC